MSEMGSRWRSWGTPLAVTVLVVAAIAWLVATGRPPEGSGTDDAAARGAREAQVEDSVEAAIWADMLRPSMTLLDVERRSGVSADSIIAELGLPRDVSKGMPLGALTERHGVTYRDIWQARESVRARQRR